VVEAESKKQKTNKQKKNNNNKKPIIFPPNYLLNIAEVTYFCRHS